MNYTYKGRTYSLFGNCKIKAGQGYWIDGIVYLGDGQMYVREIADFESKFKKVVEASK